jgi:hypothetical protein
MNVSERIPNPEEIVRRVCGEYLEMPGLRLKQEQAQRLWGLDRTTCARLLDALVKSGFLYRHVDGGYGRRSDGAVKVPTFQMLKADLETKASPGSRKVPAA